MKEFMLLIRSEAGAKENFSPEQHREFVTKCEVYIEKLTKQGNLVAAQPLKKEGKMITSAGGSWKESTFAEAEEIIVGYYHILANDLKAAIAIAKENPEFVYNSTARVEVRVIKMKEEVTGFTYPSAT